MCSIVRSPTDVVPRDVAQKIIRSFGNNTIVKYNTIRWSQVSVDVLEKHCFNADDFQEAIWEEDIRISCPEPFQYHIQTWSYICDELFRRDMLHGVKMRNGGALAMDKWDFRRLDDDDAYRKGIWIIHLDDLIRDVENNPEEEIEDEVEALAAWSEYQNGKITDDISEETMKTLEARIEMYLEVKADIVRGK